MGKSYVEEEENCRLNGARDDVQRRKEVQRGPDRPCILRPVGDQVRSFPSAQC